MCVACGSVYCVLFVCSLVFNHVVYRVCGGCSKSVSASQVFMILDLENFGFMV